MKLRWGDIVDAMLVGVIDGIFVGLVGAPRWGAVAVALLTYQIAYRGRDH